MPATDIPQITESIGTDPDAWSTEVPTTLAQAASAIAGVETFRQELVAGYEGSGVSTTYTIEFYDASGNTSATTSTGSAFRLGDLIIASGINITNIDATGMTPSDPFRMKLPYTHRAGYRGMGLASIANLSSIPGTGTFICPIGIQSANYLEFHSISFDGGPATLTWAHMDDDVSDIFSIFFQYPRVAS